MAGSERRSKTESRAAPDETARFLKNVFASIQDGISVLDDKLTILSVNPVMERWYAHALPLVGKKCYAAYHGADHPCAVCPTGEALRTGKTTHTRVPKRDARWAVTGWFDLFSFPLVDHETGAVTGVIEHVRDISEQVRAEEARAASDAKLRALLGAMKDVILVVDREGRYLEIAPTNPSLLYRPAADLIGKTLHEVFPRSQADFFLAHVRRALRERRVVEMDYDMTINGQRVWFAATVSPLREDAVVFVARDVTQKHEADAILRRYQLLAEQARDIILFVRQRDGRIVEANHAAELAYGYTREELLARTIFDLRAADPRPLVQAQMEQAASAGILFEASHVRKDGSRFPVEVSSQKIGGCASEDEGLLLSVVRDISDRVRAQEELRRAEERYQALFEQSPTGVFVYGRDQVISECNARFAEIMRAPKEKLVGFDHHALRDTSIKPAIEAPLRGKTGAYEGPYRTTVAGLDLWVGLRTAPLRGGNGEIVGGIGVIQDLTEQQRAKKDAQRLAFHDALTDLPNRALLNDRLRLAIAGAQRSRGKVGVLVLDLDRFKDVNDSLGQAAGDELLRAVAGRLTGLVRAVDTVARSGADEFTLVLADVKHTRDVVRLCDRVLALLRRSFTLFEREVYISGSLGVALYPDDGSAVDELLENAEAAMQGAKRNGGDGYRFFDASMTRRAAERLRLEGELRQAIAREEFVAHYQPQIDLDDNVLVGVEALARWHHPQRGLVQPGEFIEFAEETGMIGAIGERVLRLACGRVRDWQRETNRPLRLAVNLSPRQFGQPDIVQTIARLLYDSGLQPEMLEVEITETAIVADLQRALRVTSELRDLGVKIALDDFGTGFSSLAHLRRLPVDRLKIDRTFVSGLPDSADDVAIVSAVIGLARNLDIGVLAEGVETVAQVDFLREHGCPEAQGYLFSRPQPPEECGRLVIAGRLEVTTSV